MTEEQINQLLEKLDRIADVLERMMNVGEREMQRTAEREKILNEKESQ